MSDNYEFGARAPDNTVNSDFFFLLNIILLNFFGTIVSLGVVIYVVSFTHTDIKLWAK